MTLNEFIAKTLSVPYQEKGRDYLGWDCWAVPYLAYRDVLGIDLPSYTDSYTDPGNTSVSREELGQLISGEKLHWQQVMSYEPMDVVLFTLGGQPVHVGLMIDSRRFLHCEKKIGTVIEMIDSAVWKRRLDGVYRLEGACVCPK